MNTSKNRLFFLFGGIVLFLVLFFLFISLQKPKKEQETSKKSTLQNQDEVVPTVDSSTILTLTPIQEKKEIKMAIKGIPRDTSAVDYELSYETRLQGSQGVIGSISTVVGSAIEKQITLGTCSSGRCVYHEVVGPIKATLKFTGSYGERMLEKEFTL